MFHYIIALFVKCLLLCQGDTVFTLSVCMSVSPSVMFWSLLGVYNKHCLLAISCYNIKWGEMVFGNYMYSNIDRPTEIDLYSDRNEKHT